MDLSALTHHAVVLGATGSGKTGLCLGLLERCALANVPILAVDPKGDLGNLALTSSTLAPADFARWIDPAEAERRGLTVQALAERAAATWRAGLGEDGRGPADVAAFRDRVDVTVLTPGSEAGIPVDVLTALTRPPPGLAADREGLTDYVVGAVLSLLGLVGRRADPLTDPEAILLARLLGDAFAAGRELPLDVLLPAIVDPPFDRLGYFPVEDFLPRERRMALALELNALVASPAFAAWRRGVPLDVAGWLAPVVGSDGRARTPIRVLYLAHLDDAQRMFFVSLLMHAVVAWTRRLPGTGALRSLVYVDEVLGYLPPHPANPPSKAPMLRLLKQARAVGVGVVLATQNPVDMDYKALSNASTWYVGRLPARQDRERVVEAMQLGDAEAATLHERIATLPGRTFLWRDATRGTVRELRSPHTLCYLRGPLTRREVAALPQARPEIGPDLPADGRMRAPPTVPEGWSVRWLDPAQAEAWGTAVLGGVEAADGPTWRAAVYARVRLRFDDGDWSERRVEHRLWFPLDGSAGREIALDDAHLLARAPAGGLYAPLPGWIDEASEGAALRARVVDGLRLTETSERVRFGEAAVVGLEGDDVAVEAWTVVWVPVGGGLHER